MQQSFENQDCVTIKRKNYKLEMNFLDETQRMFGWPLKQDRQVVEAIHIFYGPLELQSMTN